MDEATGQLLIDDVAALRADLYAKYCEGQENETESVVQLAGQLLLQALVCLDAVYNGNHQLISKHAIVMVMKCLEKTETEEPEVA